MRLNQLVVIGGVAAGLCFCAGTLSAQNNNTNGNANGGDQGRRGRGNFDPAQFQQRMLDNVKEQLAFTNDTEWAAVLPLVQKVMDARRDVFTSGMGGFGRRGGGGNNDQGGRRGAFGQPSVEAEALQKALDSNAPTAQVKAALEKYRASRKDKEAKLTRPRKTCLSR